MYMNTLIPQCDWLRVARISLVSAFFLSVEMDTRFIHVTCNTVQIACGEFLGTYKTISPYKNFVRSENVKLIIRGSKRASQKKVRQSRDCFLCVGMLRDLACLNHTNRPSSTMFLSPSLHIRIFFRSLWNVDS
jgi:hypothetical protein